MSVADFKQEFVRSDPDQWTRFPDPVVWANAYDGYTIRVAKPFEYDRLHGINEEKLVDLFGSDRVFKIGNVRVEEDGVPRYECDMFQVGEGTSRLFVHGDVTAVSTDLDGFQDHLGRVMTAPFDSDYHAEMAESSEDS